MVVRRDDLTDRKLRIIGEDDAALVSENTCELMAFLSDQISESLKNALRAAPTENVLTECAACKM